MAIQKQPDFYVRNCAGRALLSISMMQSAGVNSERAVSQFFKKYAGSGLEIESFFDSRKVNGKGAEFIRKVAGYDVREYGEKAARASEMLAGAGVGRMKSDFILRTFADVESNGEQCMDYKISVLEQTTREPPKQGGIVLYPGSHLDFHHAVLLDANSSQYKMIDPAVSLEESVPPSAKQLLGLSSGGNTFFSRPFQHSLRANLKDEGAVFEIHSQAFLAQESGQGSRPGQIITLSQISSPISSVIIKKPTGDLYGLLDPAGGLGKLMGAISSGGYFLYSDFSGRVARVADAIKRMGMEKVSEGELNCKRVLSGSDSEEYPAMLFRKQ